MNLKIFLEHTFTATTGMNVTMTSTEPIDFFHLFFATEVKRLIFTETTGYAEQRISSSEQYLESHKHARGNHWRKNPMTFEQLNPFLSVIILMGFVNFPTIR